MDQLSLVDIVAAVLLCLVIAFVDKIPNKHVDTIIVGAWGVLAVIAYCPTCAGAPYVIWGFAMMTAMLASASTQ
jgi:hypothetical protein